jgi:hypothetical protein
MCYRWHREYAALDVSHQRLRHRSTCDVQQLLDAFGELRRGDTRGQLHPLKFTKAVGHRGIGHGTAVDRNGDQECPVGGHQVRAVDCKLPFQPEIALGSVARLGRDQRHEERAGSYLPANLLVPGVATAKFALVKPNFDTGGTQRGANPQGRLRVF